MSINIVLYDKRLMERIWASIHDNVNFPVSREASSPSSDLLQRELSVRTGITREIGVSYVKKWGVPSEWGLAGQDFEGGPGRFVRGF